MYGFIFHFRRIFLSLREHEQSNQSSIHQEQQSSYVLIRGLNSVPNYCHLKEKEENFRNHGLNNWQFIFDFKKGTKLWHF